jgi:DNA polymerase-3 subunit beta
MKLKANKAAMAEALQVALPIVPARSPKPILQNLCLVVEEGLLRILATDLELGIWCDVKQVKVEETGKAAIPARELSAIVRNMPDEEISLESSANDCRIKGVDSEYRLMGEDPNDYPEVPDFEGDPTFSISREEFFRMIDLTAFCAARERRRYALNGIHMAIKGNALELTATDMKRVAIVRRKIRGKVDEKKLILPTKALTHLPRMTKPDEETVDVLIEDNVVLFRTTQGVLCSRQIEGQFPPCESVIPTGYEIKVELPRETFETAVERAAILSSEDARSIRLSFEKGKLTLSSQSSDLGSARVEMPVEYSWDALEIGFNPTFLTDVLRRLETETVTLELKEPTLPGVIKGEADYTYVVMPLTLV